MWPRLSILAGLLAGVAVALLVLGGIVAFAPEPGAAQTPAPQPSISIGDPVAIALGRLGVAVRSGASGSPPASSAASAGSAAAGLFHVGEQAPALVVPQVGGGTIDLANLRGQARVGQLHGHELPAVCRRVPADERLRGSLRR